MFGSSTELITKGKLATIRSDEGLTLETSALESLYLYTAVVNSVDKPNIRFKERQNKRV